MSDVIAFFPSNLTYAVAATAASATNPLWNNSGGFTQARIYNAGTTIAFVAFGPSTTTAAVPTPGVPTPAFPIAPGATEVITLRHTAGGTYMAALMASGTASLYVTPGVGV